MNNYDDSVPQNDYERSWSYTKKSNVDLLKNISTARLPINEYSIDDNFGIKKISSLDCQSRLALENNSHVNYELSSEKVSSADTKLRSNENRRDTATRLTIIRQPELQHRARYMSEGSRGAVKDRSGSSNCTIQLIGYHRPTRVQLIAVLGSDEINGIHNTSGGVSVYVTPHPLYRLIPVSGKTTSSCQKKICEDGMECIEIVLYPENNMTAVLDCIGILKVCSKNAIHRKRKSTCATLGSSTADSGNNALQNSMKIFMRAHIPADTYGNVHTVFAITDPISCVQQLGVPEIFKMSRNCASARGGDELFIIGRNFDRNTKILFREYNEDGKLKWNAEAQIDKQYLHQCHIVCTIPPYVNGLHGGEVSLTVVCATKSSNPRGFIYAACEEYDDWRPPGSPQINSSFCLPKYDDNRQDFILLERNSYSRTMCDNNIISSGKLSVAVPRTKVDFLNNFEDLIVHDSQIATNTKIANDDDVNAQLYSFIETPQSCRLIQREHRIDRNQSNQPQHYLYAIQQNPNVATSVDSVYVSPLASSSSNIINQH